MNLLHETLQTYVAVTKPQGVREMVTDVLELVS